MKNKFETLQTKLKDCQISQDVFRRELKAYLKEIYVKASNEQAKRVSAGVPVCYFNVPYSVELDELVARIEDCIFSHPDKFMNVDVYGKNVREFDDPNIEDYDVFFCEETKFDLGKSLFHGSKKEVKLVLGLETQTIFVQILTKKTERGVNDIGVTTSAVPAYNFVNLYDRRGNNQGSYNDSVYNSIYCDRFDPSHMNNQSTNGKSKDYHENRFASADITNPKELALYEKYFKDKAYCPHFHFYRKKVCWELFGNEKSFAINIMNLSEYLRDLEQAYSSGNKSDPILNYTLGMPYLDIIKGDISCDINPFVKTAKSVIDKYYAGADRGSRIIQIYDFLLYTRKDNDAYSNITKMMAAVDFMCEVEMMPFAPSEQQMLDDRLINYKTMQEEREIKDAVLTSLAGKVVDSVGEKYNDKNLDISNESGDQPGEE